MTKKEKKQEEFSEDAAEKPDTNADEAAVEDFLAGEELNGEDVLKAEV